MSGSLPPGWYPAPGSANSLRWWDGAKWTDEVRDAGDAGAQALMAQFANGPTMPGLAPAGPAADGQASAGPAMTDPPMPVPSTGGWSVNWPGTGPMPPRALAQARPPAPPAPPNPEAELEARSEAAWRAPAVAAWEARTSGESPRRRRWFGKAKHR